MTKTPAEKRADTIKMQKEMRAKFSVLMKPKNKKQLLDEAQKLVYKAWDAPVRQRSVQLARRAIEVSPDCADAYVLLAELASTINEAIDLYRQGVKAGERALGKKCFREDVGYFWGLLETRPYMRAMNGLAGVLWAVGDAKEAITIWREMLRLNPGDNQGVRYELLACLMELMRNEEAGALLQQFEGDYMADWAYGEALLAFRLEGATEEAGRKLAFALKKNAYVPAYLIGKKKISKRLPDYVSPGEESEAVSTASAFQVSWAKTPGALEWLATVTQIGTIAPKPARSAKKK